MHGKFYSFVLMIIGPECISLCDFFVYDRFSVVHGIYIISEFVIYRMVEMTCMEIYEMTHILNRR